MGDFGENWTKTIDKAFGNINIDVVDSSKWKRTLSGTAEAVVRINTDGKVDFNKKEDEKRGTVVAEYFGERHDNVSGGTGTIPIKFSPGDEVISLDIQWAATVYTNEGYYNNPSGGSAGSVPIEGDIYKRGDTLSLTILKVLPNC